MTTNKTSEAKTINMDTYDPANIEHRVAYAIGTIKLFYDVNSEFPKEPWLKMENERLLEILQILYGTLTPKQSHERTTAILKERDEKRAKTLRYIPKFLHRFLP